MIRTCLIVTLFYGFYSFANDGLFKAIKDGNYEACKNIINSGIDINNCYVNSQPIFFWVILGGHIKIVKLFLEKGIDINKVSIDGLLSLNLAASMGNIEIVKLL